MNTQDKLAQYMANPVSLTREVLDLIDTQVNGDSVRRIDIPDTSSPFVNLVEMNAVLSANVVNEMRSVLRKMYPSLSVTPEDLYRHMSDVDYVGRFASPATGFFEFFISRDEIYSQAVEIPGSNTRKLTIPRLTQVNTPDMAFTMQYPIDIQIMSHGALSIVYNTETPSPIQTLSSNIVDFREVTIGGEKIIIMNIPIQQLVVSTQTVAVNPSAGFNVGYSFTDNYYYARVYMRNSDEQVWREIKTTHSDQVFDPARVTALLTVVGNTLNVQIPLVYFTQGMVQSSVRIDIYTTQGQVSVDLSSFTGSQFSYVLNDIDDDSTFVAPLTTFSRFSVISVGRVEGGADELTFGQLRDRVIENSTVARLPITRSQLRTRLESLGYSLVANIDHITDRQFLACREFPTVDNNTLIGGVGCKMQTLTLDMESLSESVHTADNGTQITILPSMRYQLIDGIVYPMTDSAINALEQSNAVDRIRIINTDNYLYTPFHYVLDGSNNRFDLRPYYLDTPVVRAKEFLAENDTAELQVAIDSVNVGRIASGYRLQVKVTSGDAFKALDDAEVFAQIGYRPKGETNFASVNGTIIGLEDGERVFQFDILTDYSINEDHELSTTNMSIFDNVQTDFAIPLEAEFEVSFIVEGTVGTNYVPSALDILVQDHLLPSEYSVVTREKLIVELGYVLQDLWHPHRTVVSDESYQRYEADVPYIYDQDVYEVDVNGLITWTDNGDGTATATKLHNAGDPVLTDQGAPIIRFFEGDAILDSSGNRQLIGPRLLQREVTLLLFDAAYAYANSPAAIEYRDNIPETLIGWIQNDLTSLKGSLLERTNLSLYPTQTFGNTTVLVSDDLRTIIPLEQSLSVTFYVDDVAFRDLSVRNALEVTTRQVISEELSKTTVSITNMVVALRERGSDSVIGVRIEGLGGEANYNTVSVIDQSARLSLGKRLRVELDGTIVLENALDIQFKSHDV